MASRYPSGKPRVILPPVVFVYTQPSAYKAVHDYVQRVQAEARQKTTLVYLDTDTGRPVSDVLDSGPIEASKPHINAGNVHDTVYPWSKDSIVRELSTAFETDLRKAKLCTWSEQPYGVESNQLRKDLGAILESAQLAQGIAPSYRTAAKLRSPPILVTDSEQLLGFFNRPVVLSLLGEACARHQIAPPLPLCSLRDLDPVSCRVENQPLEWGSEELPCVMVHRPLPSFQRVPDLWRRPLSAYTCVQRRIPKGFRLVFGKYELMQDGDCICRFVLHPEGHFEWWQSRLFRSEDEEKTAGKVSGQSAGQWTVGPGGVLTLEGVFNYVTSNLSRVHEKIVLPLEWLSQSWTVTEIPYDRLVRPTALQALERAPWPTIRSGTYLYHHISDDLADHGHIRGAISEDVQITIVLYETGWYEYTEERRLHRARKQTTTAAHLGRRWEMDNEMRCLRLTAPTKQALRQRRYDTGTAFEDLWVHSVEIPLARLEAEFAYYPFTGPEYPQGVPDPLVVQAHSDLNCSLASMHPHPARRLVTGGTSWQNVDPSVRPTRGAAAQMMGTNSSWRSSWRSGAFKHTEILKKTGSASASQLHSRGDLGSGVPPARSGGFTST
jgi:hypothetical protein